MSQRGIDNIQERNVLIECVQGSKQKVVKAYQHQRLAKKKHRRDVEVKDGEREVSITGRSAFDNR